MRKILNITSTAAPTERNWKHHAMTQPKLRNQSGEHKMQKLVHNSSTHTLQKKQKQELTSRITDLSKHMDLMTTIRKVHIRTKLIHGH